MSNRRSNLHVLDKAAVSRWYTGGCEDASVLHTQWHEAANFRRRDRRSLAQCIADDIRRRIVTGDLPVGHRLPSIQKLARLLGVSAPTAQAAVHILVALGFVRVSRGNGTYVRSLPNDSASLIHALLHASPVELAAMRAAIDERAAPLAAAAVARDRHHRVSKTLGELNLLAGERAARRWSYADTFLRADLAFHAAIVRSASGMEAAHEIYQAIGRRLEPAMLPGAGLLAGDRWLDEGHTTLAAAILDGNAVAAARLAHAIARREHGTIQPTPG
jgi:DNA-binding FadR family transcriptional regulator